MPLWHGNIHKKKSSGGRRRVYRGKRAFEMGREPVETTVAAPKLVRTRVRGGGLKLKLLSSNIVNIVDQATGKSQKTEITRTMKNPANADYQRRGVITKGAILETPLGQARVTSRPGHDGIINAILTGKTR